MSAIERIGIPVPPKIGEAEAAPDVRGGKGAASGGDFRAALEEAGAKLDLKFSKHAVDRMELRNVELGRAELDRLGSAISRAGEKGANESLVLLDELAFIVSIRNRTVITAMQSKGEEVFTSIDSAVIA